ncbi:Murein L,D-transpeptidase YcbB/YkuD [Chelatococcus sambhunathii]|uniref:Murein L,D-transpeptidase YcbB/YkuD n=1 Tax=Chelatococcus sambhunathii TaxID=363953 RepID=A0ABP1ZZ39_9HYPH|nr:L,D-transpeptidase family protein [Chelatococcus sambhunathii]CUA84697.1 Murein L,D-transpeptidase YcbB/YkuD [Chelatococcus sambhunathii]
MRASTAACIVAVGIGLLTAAITGRAAAEPIVPAQSASLVLPTPPAAAVDVRDIAPTEPEPPASAGTGTLAPPDLPDIAVSITADEPSVALAGRILDARDWTLPRLGEEQRGAIRAFYEARGFNPLWIADGAFTPAARKIMAALTDAAAEGLDPADYPLPQIDGLEGSSRGRALADADLKLSAAAVLYARDARGGRLEPTKLSKLLTPTRELPEAGDVLERLGAATDPGAALAAYNPQHAQYAALKRKLAEVRSERPAQTPVVRVPKGPTLRLGMQDERVPLIRARFGLDVTPDGDHTYDEKVAAAIADFQRAHGLAADGVLGAQTLAALGGGETTNGRLEADIIANMERWRWLPANLGDRHISVNIPAYMVRVLDRGEVIHEARVIVGKPETPTPVFSDVMRHVVVNPYWNVPPSILRKEFLPHMAQDPDYAARRGYEVIRRGNSISIRQPPGERNALGHIKFMFPNQHAVYLHDTPSRSLFKRSERAFSHGCVRVDDPFTFAEIVLGDAWPQSRMKKLIGKGERLVRLPELIPIHLTYFTLMVTDEGKLVRYPDIYSHDQRVAAALRDLH